MVRGYIEIVDLTKTYGKVLAVDGFSLDVQKGQFVSLLGPSGSGKTTVLRLLGGFTSPDKGHMYVNGSSIDDLPSNKREMGFVFQNYALFPHMRVFDNVAFPLRMRHVSKEEIARRTKFILGLVRLTEKEQKYPKQLSGGEQQRVALARALVFEPHVLLLDEPLSALDLRLRIQLRGELKAIQRKLGVTTIFVTHDQEEALSMSDMVVVMQSGRIEQVGTPQDIYKRPVTEFVASFIGNTNMLPGTITGKRDETALVRCGSLDIQAPVAGFESGDRVVASIKAEKIRVLGPGDASPNSFAGTVEGVTYMGQYSTYEIRVKDDLVIRAIQSSESGRNQEELPTSVRVSWEREDVVLIPLNDREPG